MELNKGDVEDLAFRKFNKKHGKRFFGILIGWIVVFIVVTLVTRPLFDETMLWPMALAVFLPMFIGFFTSMYLCYNRPQSKYIKAFLEECEANPNFTYVPEAPKETVNEETTGIHSN